MPRSHVNLTLSLDDSYINCRAAHERGWNVAHLLDRNDPTPPQQAGKYQIRSLQELREVFPEVFKTSQVEP